MGQDFTDGMTSQAMQQGGMGLILTTLIVTAPPMAAMFFQGTLGQFTAYNAMTTGYQPAPGLPQGQQASSSSSTSSPQANRSMETNTHSARTTASDSGWRHSTGSDEIKVGAR